VKALDVFKKYGIATDYDTRPDGIINRAGTGPCPMENAVANVATPEEALAAIKSKLRKMMAK
jgi:hypothetical protein